MVTQSPAAEAGPSSRPSSRNKKRKRSNVDAPESTSNNSSNKTSRNDDQSQQPKPRRRRKPKEKERDDVVEDDRDKPKSKDTRGEKEKRKEKRKKKSAGSLDASLDTAADFIALPSLDDDDDDGLVKKGENSGRNPKGKERARQNDDDQQRNGRKRSRSRSRSPDRHDDRRKGRYQDTDDKDRDRDRNRDRDRDRDRKTKGRDRTPEREWDRGKRRDRDRDRRREQPISASVRSVGNRKLPWLEGLNLSDCHNVAELLHKEVETFTRWISPSSVEDEIRSLLVERIKLAICSKFRDAEVLPFGSYATKLYLPTGDIDLVVMSQTMGNNDRHVVLRSLAEVIKRNGIASSVSIIAKARIPIIKFVTTHGHIPVDISINQGNGTVGAEVVNGFLRDMDTSPSPDPTPSASSTVLEGSIALRALVMITKMFLSQRSMNEVYTGGLGSYAIVSLVISFLQMHPKIRRGEIAPDRNLGVLLIEFFELYGSYFNYENVGISVRDGGTYFNKRQRGWGRDENSNYKGRAMSTLSIEDPIDISNDISSGSYGFSKVRATFAGAHQILTATAYLKAGILSARRSGQHTSLRHGREEREYDEYGYEREKERPEEMSILAHIIDVTQDIINHRRVIQEVYDQRILHDMLHVKPRVVVVDARVPNPSPNGNLVPVRGLSNGRTTPPSINSVGSQPRPTMDLEEGEILIISSDDPPEGVLETKTKRSPHQSIMDEEEEEGKYGIKLSRSSSRSVRQPPRKRRRTGGAPDVDTVFTTFNTDDENSEDGDSDSEDGSSDETDSTAEEAEYDLDFDAPGVDVDADIDTDTLAMEMAMDDMDASTDPNKSKTKNDPEIKLGLDAKDGSGGPGGANRTEDEKAAIADTGTATVSRTESSSPSSASAAPTAATNTSTKKSPSAAPVSNSTSDAEMEKSATSNKPPSSSERKRSYWLSKGIGSGAQIADIAEDV